MNEVLVLFILERIQFIKVLVLQSVLVCPVLGRNQGLLNQRFRVFWFLGNNSMLTKDIVPKSTGVLK